MLTNDMTKIGKNLVKLLHVDLNMFIWVFDEIAHRQWPFQMRYL